MISTKQYRSTQPGLSDLLNYAAVIAPGVILNKNGSLLAGFFYRGSDLASSTVHEMADVSARVNRALLRLGSGWVLHCDAVRIESVSYPLPSESYFPDKVTRWIDEERRRQFQQVSSHYESIYALLVTYLPPLRSHSQLTEMMFDDDRRGRTNKRAIADRTMQYFEQTLKELQDSLAQVVEIERMLPTEFLDEFGTSHTREPLLQYLNFAITGENHPVNLPPIPMYLDSLLGCRELFGGVTPKLGDTFISVVAIDGFPSDSHPQILQALDELPFHYRWSTRFIMLDQHEAENEMKKYRRKWAQKVRGFFEQVFNTGRGVVNQDAAEMVSEVDEAIALVSNGAVLYGYYTSVVILLSSDREMLEAQARDVKNTIQGLGFTARIESVNTIEAWLGSLPSHALENVRRPLINTLNVADLLPLSSIWPGREHCPCPFYPPHSPALFHAATDGWTPFRFNLHYTDLGHTLILGPTGAGKSVLLAFIVAQFRRYKNSRVFAFDKGRSLLALTKAAEGVHYEIAGDHAHSPAFCPLNEIDTDGDLGWAEEWIVTCLELRGVKVTPAQRNLIHTGMLTLRASPKGKRSLTAFCSNLQDVGLRDALQHYTIDGTMGRLLDSERDDMRDARFQTFEIEDLMNLGPENALPVLLYIFRVIERSLDGTPTIIPIDEAWLVLGHPVFRKKIQEWLKVLRKANAAVILATQSLSDAQKSGILDVLIEACPTKIYLPNPDATQDVPRPLYESMGLNQTQIQLIADARKKKDYYFSSPEGRRMFQLNLGPVALAFVAVSGKEQVKRVRDLSEMHPETWPSIWLEELNIQHETART